MKFKGNGVNNLSISTDNINYQDFKLPIVIDLSLTKLNKKNYQVTITTNNPDFEQITTNCFYKDKNIIGYFSQKINFKLENGVQVKITINGILNIDFSNFKKCKYVTLSYSLYDKIKINNGEYDIYALMSSSMKLYENY